MSRYLYWMWLLQGIWWKFLVATLNSNTKIKTKPFKTARAELPSLPARFCKIWNGNFLKIFTFSQEFLLSWDKDLDFLLAGHWEYMFLLLLGGIHKGRPLQIGDFWPPPPLCPSYDVTVTTQVSLLCPLWADPPLPYLGRPLWMPPKGELRQLS